MKLNKVILMAAVLFASRALAMGEATSTGAKYLPRMKDCVATYLSSWSKNIAQFARTHGGKCVKFVSKYTPKAVSSTVSSLASKKYVRWGAAAVAACGVVLTATLVAAKIAAKHVHRAIPVAATLPSK